jgi:hypothetical protein
MKTWHTVLIGGVGGPLIGLLITFTVPSVGGSWFSYPWAFAYSYLDSVLHPNSDMGDYRLGFALLLIYFAAIGVLLALAGRWFWRKLSV